MRPIRKIGAVLTVTAVVIILIALVYTQSVNPPTTQLSSQEKALIVIRDILGLNFEKYTPKLNNNFTYNSIKYNGLLEEDIAYTMEANDSKVFIVVSFVNNSLNYIDLSNLNGSTPIHYTQQLSSDPITATRTVLSRLQRFTGDPIMGKMQNFIGEVSDINAANVSVGNFKCQVLIHSMPINRSYAAKGISIYFMYSFNDTDSPKSISIHFQDGVLKTVANTWNLFKIGSQDIKITKEQAIEIAKAQANNSTSAPFNFTSIRPIITELHMAVRGNLTLYPLWSVELPLDYPGASVNGWHTTIWADTGEVASGTPLFGSMP
jgi:hypothetical protein